MGALKNRLLHDCSRGILHDEGRRYIMMRADVLMGIVREVPDDLRDAVLEAMAKSTARGGGRSAQTYFDSVGRDPVRLTQVLAESAADLGWGAWTFERVEGEGWSVTVRCSPFAEGHGASPVPVCAPIAGMLRSLGGMLLAWPVCVRETRCVAQGHDTCVFEISRACGP